MNISKEIGCGPLEIFSSLGPGAFMQVLMSKLLSIEHYYILTKSLAAPLVADPSIAKRALKGTLSPLTNDDIASIKNELAALDPEDRRELLARMVFFRNGFTNCYVLKAGEEVAYLQWLLYPSDNDILRLKYPNRFYPLGERQVMIENVFIFPRYRGRGYLPSCTFQLLQTAKEKGYASAVCYIRKDRISSLNEFQKMGFRIVKMVTEYKILGKVWRTL